MAIRTLPSISCLCIFCCLNLWILFAKVRQNNYDEGSIKNDEPSWSFMRLHNSGKPVYFKVVPESTEKIANWTEKPMQTSIIADSKPAHVLK